MRVQPRPMDLPEPEILSALVSVVLIGVFGLLAFWTAVSLGRQWQFSDPTEFAWRLALGAIAAGVAFGLWWGNR